MKKGEFRRLYRATSALPHHCRRDSSSPVTTENISKQRAEAEESSSFELLVLMKEMREEMRRRDE